MIIRDELKLVDHYSSVLDKVASKSTSTSRAVQAAQRQVRAENAAAAQSVTANVSAATQSIVDRLGVFQDAVDRSYTRAQRTENLDKLASAMRRCGLVATNAANEENMAALLAKDSLQSLADSGAIAANTVAEASYREAEAKRQAIAAAAMERDAARQTTIVKQAAAAAIRAEESAMKQAAAAAKAEEEAQEAAADATRQHRAAIVGTLTWLPRHTAELLKNAGAAARARQSHDALSKRLIRMGLMMFTARRMLRFLSDSLERAPDGIQKSWSAMTSGLKDTVARGFVAMLQGMQPAIDRFNAFMNSEKGQRIARGIETAMRMAGTAVGWLLDKITALGEWIGGHFQSAMQAAVILIALYAANMLVAAAATAAANWPVLLLIASVVMMAQAFNAAGFTSEQVFGAIGKGAGWLYALCYNLIADAWNLIAGFAEFFANVFNDPVAAVGQLFSSVFTAILHIVETAASAIDKLLGTNMAGGISSFTKRMQSGIDMLVGKNKITINRMDHIGYTDTANVWGAAASGLAGSFSNFSLDNAAAVALKNIDKNTASTAKSVKNLSDEELKYIEDVAVRKYTAQINTTSLTPHIVVNVKGSGNKEDADYIAASIADILARQAAAHTSLSYSEAGV